MVRLCRVPRRARNTPFTTDFRYGTVFPTKALPSVTDRHHHHHIHQALFRCCSFKHRTLPYCFLVSLLYASAADHNSLLCTPQTFVCKKCRKAFRKNTQDWDESDEYCPNCDNHFVIDALTPKAALKVESEDTRMDARMLKDERVRQPEQQSIFDVKNAETRLV